MVSKGTRKNTKQVRGGQSKVSSQTSSKVSSQQSTRKAGARKKAEPAKPPVIRIPTPKKTNEIQIYETNYPDSPKAENRQEMEEPRCVSDYYNRSKDFDEYIEDVDFPTSSFEYRRTTNGATNPSYFTFETENGTKDDLDDRPRREAADGHENSSFEDKSGHYDPVGRSPLTSPVTGENRDAAYDHRDDHYEIPFVPTDAGRGAEGHSMRRVSTYASLATHDTMRVPIFKARDAESRLFDPTLGYNVELRHAFEFPDDIRTQDVAVYLGTMLERGRGNPRRDELAAGVKAVLRTTFGDKFPMSKQRRTKKEKLLIKVYVVDVSEGDRESRMYAPDCEVGLVRLCLAWIACTPDGNIVFDGGRVGMTDSLGMGVLDALHLTTGLTVLTTKLAPRLARQIIDRLNVKSDKTFFGLW